MISMFNLVCRLERSDERTRLKSSVYPDTQGELIMYALRKLQITREIYSTCRRRSIHFKTLRQSAHAIESQYVGYVYRVGTEVSSSRLAIDKFSETRSALIPDYLHIDRLIDWKRVRSRAARNYGPYIRCNEVTESRVVRGRDPFRGDAGRGVLVLRLVLFSETIGRRFSDPPRCQMAK